jgi:NTP pyrophosphatase (non-canonical NTP hydrolase)
MNSNDLPIGLALDKIREWGSARKIIGPMAKATGLTQYSKLHEEMGELLVGLLAGNKDEIEDAIGDCCVVLTLLAELEGLRLEDCVASAYAEISSRKGQMINGVFVKED